MDAELATRMKAYRQVHVYPLLVGWVHIEVMVIGEVGRKTKGQPFEYRYWVPQEVYA